MFWCDKCKIWEHEKCLADAIRKEFIKTKLAAGSATKKPRKSLGKNINITIAASSGTEEVTATIEDKDQKHKSESVDGSESNLKSESDDKKDPMENGDKVRIAVKCLKCGNQLK
jgi:hypothetical protein